MPCKADEDLSIEATITSFPPNKVKIDDKKFFSETTEISRTKHAMNVCLMVLSCFKC